MSRPRPEIRRDPLSGHWVIIAAERALRPEAFVSASEGRAPSDRATCPFCPGREMKTPPETAALRRAGSLPDRPGWRVRVVPNKYPALVPGSGAASGPLRFPEGETRVFVPAAGVHEVIVETPDHGAEIPDRPARQTGEAWRMVRDRLREIEKRAAPAYIQVFKNKGRLAGASLSHPHIQIASLPIVPRTVQAELDSARRFYARDRACPFCRILKDETADGRRIVHRNEAFVVTAPFASRVPYELRLQPVRHAPRFAAVRDGELRLLAEALRTVLGRVKSRLSDPAYNIVLYEAPCPGRGGRAPASLPFYHWHLDILPVLSRLAGFEWGTGFFINAVTPEEAAASLR